MLKEFGISYCLVGHSERRANLGETDEMVAKKAAALQKAGIHPVICVGETEAQRRRGEALKVVRAQLTEALSAVKADGTPIVVAYEPVWAIGTGKSCSSEDAKEVHEAIRALLVKKLGKTGETVPILYGGSVDVRNVVEFLSTTHIDGVLVGSASLDPRNFGLLCRTALPA
jgi:triosephosphate isomerase